MYSVRKILNNWYCKKKKNLKRTYFIKHQHVMCFVMLLLVSASNDDV